MPCPRIRPIFRAFGAAPVAAAALAAALWVPPTHAAPAESGPEAEKAKREAKKDLAGGDQAYAAHDYEGALAHYRQAYQAFASPKILYPIGLAEYQLGDRVRAYAALYQYLADATNAEPALAADARVKLAELQGRIARVAFVLHPADTALTIDGKDLGVPSPSMPVLLEPGTHTVRLTRPPFWPIHYRIVVAAGHLYREERELFYRLPASRPAGTAASAPKPAN